MRKHDNIVWPMVDNATPGSDTLTGEPGDDTLRGLAGDDFLYGMDGADVLRGGIGDDWLDGGEGDDAIGGGDGVDTLQGGKGHDRLAGGSEADLMAGGAGDDVYLVDNSGDGVIEFAGEGDDKVVASVDFQLTENIERLRLTGDGALTGFGMAGFDGVIRGNEGVTTLIGFNGAETFSGGDGDDWLDGDAGDDVLAGDAGDDTVQGGEGNDTLIGGPGIDDLFGGLGDDVFHITDWPTAPMSGEDYDYPIAYLNDGYDIVYSTVNLFGFVEYIERCILVGDDPMYASGWSDYGFTFYGNQGDTTLQGAGGDDFLYGRAGNDTLYGDYGNDTLRSGSNRFIVGDYDSGYDELHGGPGDDLYVLDNPYVFIGEDQFSGGFDTVLIKGVGAYPNPYIERIILGKRAEWAEGWELDETVIGNDQFNFIVGHGGSDRLLGRGGKDSLYGDDADGPLEGVAGDDSLWGDEGDDLLAGGSGNDWLVGGAGDDELFGGGEFILSPGTNYSAGADIFVFEVGSIDDVIRDFSTDDGDRIHLKRIDADIATEANDAFTFIGDAAFSGAAGELRYEALASGEGFMLYGETDGVAGADIAIEVRTTGASLELAHFVL